MNEELMNQLIASGGAILLALIGWGTRAVVQYFNKKGITETIISKDYILNNIVYGVKDIYKREGGERKKQKAIQFATEQFKKNGWAVDDKEIELFVGAAYQAMKTAVAEQIKADNIVASEQGVLIETEDVIISNSAEENIEGGNK